VTHRQWLAGVAEGILATLLSVGLFASGSFFPILGVALRLLSPLPVVLLRLRHGRLALALALGSATLVLAGAVSPRQAVAFLLEFGLPAILLAEGLRWVDRLEVVAVGVAALLTLGGIGGLVLSAEHWGQPLTSVGRHVEAMLAEMEAFPARLGLPGDGPGPVAASAPTLRAFLLTTFPALLFAGSLLTAAGYVLLVHALARRWPEPVGGLAPRPFRWELPEVLVWAFIGAGVLYLTGLPWLQPVGLNGLIILGSLYFVQGLSIAAFLFQRFQVPRVLAALSILLLVLQPFLALLVAGVGLFDVWFAFRRLSLPKTPRRT
jgi:uncharacterized protein YybS (DUF2232 family)